MQTVDKEPAEVVPGTALESEVIKNVRAYIRRNGTPHAWKLSPIVRHDNRMGGAYSIGRNAAKREKRKQLAGLK